MMPDYLEMLQNAKHGSFLEDIDELNTEVWFKDLLKSGA